MNQAQALLSLLRGHFATRRSDLALIATAALSVALLAPRVASADPDDPAESGGLWCNEIDPAPVSAHSLSDLMIGSLRVSRDSDGLTFSMQISWRTPEASPVPRAEAQTESRVSAVPVWLEAPPSNVTAIVRVDGYIVDHQASQESNFVRLTTPWRLEGAHSVELEFAAGGETKPVILAIVGDLTRGRAQCLRVANRWSPPGRAPQEIVTIGGRLCLQSPFWGISNLHVVLDELADPNDPDNALWTSSGNEPGKWWVDLRVRGGPSWWMLLPAALVVLLVASVAARSAEPEPVPKLVISIWRNVKIATASQEPDDYRAPSVEERVELRCVEVIRVESARRTFVTKEILVRATAHGVELDLRVSGSALSRPALVPLESWVQLRDEWIWIGRFESPGPPAPPVLTVADLMLLPTRPQVRLVGVRRLLPALAFAYAAPFWWTVGAESYVVVSSLVALCASLVIYTRQAMPRTVRR